jgi:hypothetical protein
VVRSADDSRARLLLLVNKAETSTGTTEEEARNHAMAACAFIRENFERILFRDDARSTQKEIDERVDRLRALHPRLKIKLDKVSNYAQCGACSETINPGESVLRSFVTGRVTHFGPGRWDCSNWWK